MAWPAEAVYAGDYGLYERGLGAVRFIGVVVFASAAVPKIQNQCVLKISIVVGSAGFVLLALLVLIVAIAFWGNPMQSQTALTLLGYSFAAVGGSGILFLIMYAVNTYIKWWQGL